MTAPALPGNALVKRRSAAMVLADAPDSELARSQGYDASAGASRTAIERRLAGGQDALDTWTRSAVDAGMPAFNQALQGVRETAIRRGVGLGDLGTSYEGDLASAFHRNIANAVSAQAMSLYNTQLGTETSLYGTDVARAEEGRNRYYDLLAGNRDYDIAQENARRQRRSGLFGALGGVLGAVGGGIIGSVIPGVGTLAGATLGSRVGGSAGAGIGG